MKKGFTLIELLAVILILGIIALIAIPTVNNIITESKKGAFKSTISNLTSTLERQCETEKVKGVNITKQYIFLDNGSFPSIEMKGQLPTNGIAYVNDDCDVTLSVSNGNYTAEKNVSEDKTTITDGANANYQIKKFYFDKAKKAYLYVAPSNMSSEEGINWLTSTYGKEFTDIISKTKEMSLIFYVDETDGVLEWYTGYNFDKNTSSETITKFTNLLKNDSKINSAFNVGDIHFIDENNSLICLITDKFKTIEGLDINELKAMKVPVTDLISSIYSTTNIETKYNATKIVIE